MRLWNFGTDEHEICRELVDIWMCIPLASAVRRGILDDARDKPFTFGLHLLHWGLAYQSDIVPCS